MRRWWILLLILLVAGAAIWGFGYREKLARQWHCYRVATADSFADAQQELAWFEQEPPCDVRLRELVAKWGTGSAQFDWYLARHLADPRCSDALRQHFVEHLEGDKALADRWAHFWRYRAAMEPTRQVASVVTYLDTLYEADASHPITWRDVLDLQAVFYLLGERQGTGLSPTTWQEHYRVWRETRRKKDPPITRPAKPFADWQGPPPK